MHDHATDGGRRSFEANATAYALRLHLDNAHDLRTNGAGYDHLAELHRGAHAAEAARLAEIEAAANIVAERLAAGPPAVVESIVADDTDRLYHDLHAARERLCRAQTLLVDTALGRHARGNLGRAIHLIDAVGAEWCDQWSRFDQPAETLPVVDLMEALEESLAKAKRTLGMTSGTAQPPDAPAGAGEQTPPLPAPPSPEDVNALRSLIELSEGWSDDQRARFILSSNWLRDRTPPTAPSSTAAPNLLRDGEATGAAVGPIVGGGAPLDPCPAERPAPSGAASSEVERPNTGGAS